MPNFTSKSLSNISQKSITCLGWVTGGFSKTITPKHTSRLAKAFLDENAPVVMDWPSNSPDLNPIENLWAIVKGNVEKRMPKNINELEQFMVEEWRSISDTVIINL